MSEGERRTPLCGVGSEDNERWFRFYGTDVMFDLAFLSPEAALVYLQRLTQAYSQMGDLTHVPPRRNWWFSTRKVSKAVAELREAGLLVGEDDMPKHYDPRHHGFAIQRKAIPADVREHVFDRDGHACVYCGDTDRLTLDHIIPVSDRGSDHSQNLVTACLACNIAKGKKPAGAWSNG